MRIWHLLSNRWNSAVTEYALSAARALAGVGHTCLFTPLAGSPAERRALEARLDVRSVQKFALSNLSNLKFVESAFKPEVILTYGGPETFVAPWLTQSRPIVRARFRGQALPPPGFFSDLKFRLSQRHSDMVLTPSEGLAQAIKERSGHQHVASVVLGCDTTRFKRETLPLVENVSPRPSRPELVIFGRFDPVKGHAAFMEMVARIIKSRDTALPKPFLHIVGQAANLSSADLYAAGKAVGLEVGSDFEITEQRVADVPALMSRATLGVVSSLGSELICRVAEEFLLCGTPVLVSGVGSLSEVLLDPSFGADYSKADKGSAGEIVPEIVPDIVNTWIDRSWSETEAEKIARASLAAAHFSLETMGNALSRHLEATAEDVRSAARKA